MEVDQKVLEVLQGVSWNASSTVCKIKNKLDRKLYKHVEKVLEALGGKWSRPDQGIKFSTPEAQDAVADVVATGRYIDWKKARQYFPTPDGLAYQMMDMAGIGPGVRTLEPSAGTGALVFPALEYGATVVAVEIHPPYVEEMKRNIRSRFDGFPDGLMIRHHDFMTYQPEDMKPFDAVVMNPPFALGADMEFVRHATGFLRPGGVLVSVMSPGWTYRQTRKAATFRKLALGLGAEWTEIQDGAFRLSGTGVSTGFFKIRRP